MAPPTLLLLFSLTASRKSVMSLFWETCGSKALIRESLSMKANDVWWWWLMTRSGQLHLALNWNRFLIPDWSVNMGEVSLLMSDSNCPETTAVKSQLWGRSGWISTRSSSHRSGHRSRVKCFSQLLWQIPPVRPLKFIIMINLWLHRVSCCAWLIPSDPGLTFEGLLSCAGCRSSSIKHLHPHLRNLHDDQVSFSGRLESCEPERSAY